MAESDVKVRSVGIFSEDIRGELVLLILQDEGKTELVPHLVEIEFGYDAAVEAIVIPVFRRDQAFVDNTRGDPDLVQHFKSGRMNRGGSLVFYWSRFLLKDRDRNATLV
jgi:hypothetical protein